MRMSMPRPALLALALVLCGRPARAAFGLTSTSSSYRVDTDGGLVFEVSRKTGDVTSLLYRGTQYQGTTKNSHINSGLGADRTTVAAESVLASAALGGVATVKITVKAGAVPVTHYYVARAGDPTIYMATHITGEVDPGELRWLARLKRSAVPNGWHGDAANLDGCTAFEGKDTFKCPNGQTRCKMYTADRFIEDIVHGVTGKNVGIWMIMPGTAYETSSGGPFMRDINSQSGSDQELYWYMNSGHVRTEPWRFGLMGPYAMQFTTGSMPAGDLDTSFFAGLNVTGYVPLSGRGRIQGKATGVSADKHTVLHWHNSAAQYWAVASALENGAYVSPPMKPGTYAMKMYRNEYLVAQDTVTVTVPASAKGGNVAPVVATKDMVAPQSTTPVVWRIGSFDGQPLELKNGDRIERMHPADVRMQPWGGNYTVGRSVPSDFPMALFAKQGGVATVRFSLTQEQVAAGAVLRVGTTLSFKGGRPSVKINSWSGKDPGAPKLIDSRGVTRGAYRGYGDVYTWSVPASALRTGNDNTLTLGVFGSGDAEFLSANYVVDAVELQGRPGPDSPAG